MKNARLAAGNDLRTGVRPFVRDTRNVLLIRPVSNEVKATDQFLTSLGYSLQRGMQLLFQVEQQEIALEQIGEHDNRRLLFWEAAEGGNGIWQLCLIKTFCAGKMNQCRYGVVPTLECCWVMSDTQGFGCRRMGERAGRRLLYFVMYEESLAYAATA
jgi:hypothetical protein